MKRLVLHSGIAVLATVTLLFVALPAAAQNSAATETTWTPSHLSDGQPDVQGFWRGQGEGLFACDIETGYCDEGHTKLTGVGRNQKKVVSMITDPPDGKIPYQAWAIERRKEMLRHYGKPRSLAEVTPQLVCICGAPRLNYFSEFQILQTPGYLVMQYEWGHTFRVIAMDKQPHVQQDIKLYMGDSRGHWEGNTLVVETTNMKDWTWFDEAASFHSDAMSLVERYTWVDANTVKYQATIQDPKVYTRPWTIAEGVTRSHTAADNWELMEAACTEGERDLPRILRGDEGGPGGDEAFHSPGRPIE